jgi:hypothetical protein
MVARASSWCFRSWANTITSRLAVPDHRPLSLRSALSARRPEGPCGHQWPGQTACPSRHGQQSSYSDENLHRRLRLALSRQTEFIQRFHAARSDLIGIRLRLERRKQSTPNILCHRGSREDCCQRGQSNGGSAHRQRENLLFHDHAPRCSRSDSADGYPSAQKTTMGKAVGMVSGKMPGNFRRVRQDAQWVKTRERKRQDSQANGGRK